MIGVLVWFFGSMRAAAVDGAGLCFILLQVNTYSHSQGCRCVKVPFRYKGQMSEKDFCLPVGRCVGSGNFVLGSQFGVIGNDNSYEEENGVKCVSNLLESHTTVSSVLQGILRKLGAGLGDLLSPSLPFSYVKRDMTAPVSSANSTTIFSIRGNVYPDGLYSESMLVRKPPKPYHLGVDTGSDLT